NRDGFVQRPTRNIHADEVDLWLFGCQGAEELRRATAHLKFERRAVVKKLLRAEPGKDLRVVIQASGVINAQVLLDLSIIQGPRANLPGKKSPGHGCFSSGCPFLTQRSSLHVTSAVQNKAQHRRLWLIPNPDEE